MAKKAAGVPILDSDLQKLAGARTPREKQWWAHTAWGPRPEPGGFTPEYADTYRARIDAERSDVLGVGADGRTVNPYGTQPDRLGPRQVRIWQDAQVAARKEESRLGTYDGSTYTPNDYGGPWSAMALAGRPRRAAPLTIVPTSTINSARPRTVAAGFELDPKEGLGRLTVVFRDGTYYNYYDVTEDEWEKFKMSPSKGRFIASVLDGKTHGIADMAGMDARVASLIYRQSRASQMWHYRKGTKAAKGAAQLRKTPGANTASYALPKPNSSKTHPSYLGKGRKVSKKARRPRVS